MRKIWQSSHHIRYVAFAMAAVIGLLPPCAAIAAEENAAEEVTDENESVSGDDLEGEAAVTYITAFEPLGEEETLLSLVEKPDPEELTDLFPETLSVRIEGEEETAELEVEWESEEDYAGTKLERYTFYPKWDEELYLIADSAKDEIEIPSITVEVPAEQDQGMIPELEEAENDLQEIIENKSILALVYLCDEYEVKSEPSSDADTVHTVVSGQSVQITGVKLDEGGNVWYQTLFYQNGEEYTGYIERGYLAASDEDFIQWAEEYIVLPPAPRMMRARRAAVSYPDVEQFPASYQNALYELKRNHPNWVFVKMETGIDWNTAIAREMGEKSLIHSSSPASWKNGPHGQPGWSYASEGILRYYMDPRNFLTDSSIFQFEQLTYNKSYHTAEAVQEIIKSSFMSSTIPGDSCTYAQAFTTIGQSTGVSPFHLASRVLQEQGTNGTSPLISGTYSGYEGYYNYFNVGASGSSNAEVIQNGLKKAKNQGWNTRFKSLSGGAYVIGKNYILRGQDTLYLQKFNVSGGGYPNFEHQYMQNIEAPATEAPKIRKAYNNAGALENSFVFKIPVYSNMPASACTKPDTTDVITFDKTSVDSLAVNKTVKLIPYVNGAKVDYISNMTFASDTPSVATVDDVGRVTAVSPGRAVISCTGGKGGKAVCTVTVVKADPEISTPTLSPCTYREGLRLSDISLPDGWTWTQEVTNIEAGTHSYEALYTPEDTVKYNTVTRNISFKISKVVPTCVMPEEPRVFVGTTLGEITLPKGFTWESETEITLQEPGEYTFYVTYSPDETNYHPVNHIPLIVQVIGESSGSGEEDDPPTGGGSTGSGTTTGGSTGTGSGSGTTSGGTTSDGSTGTGSGSGTTSGGTTSDGSTGTGSGSGTTSGGTTSSGSTGTGSGSGTTSGGTTSGGSTGTGSGSGTTSGGTTSGGSTGTGSGSGTGSSGNTGTSGGTTSGGSTGTGSGSGTTSGGTTSGGSTGTGSGSGTTSGGTTSGGSTGTGSGTTSGGTTSGGSTGTGSGTGSSGNTGTSGGTTSVGTTTNNSAGSGTSNTGAPLKELPKPSSSNNDKKSDSSGGSSQSNQNGAESGQANGGGGSQTAQNGTDNGRPVQNADNGQANGEGGSQTARNGAGNAQPTQNGAGSGQGQSGTGSSQSDQKTEGKSLNVRTDRKDADQRAKGETDDSQTTVTEGGQEQESEKSVSKPAVTMDMEDITILTPENLQMAKNQNLDLLLKMGKYATWSIDIDSVNMDAISEVDMGIELGTEHVPTQIIADILDGNKYLEFTLAHDGLFGFHSLLQIAIDPMYEGWYANLFYYDEEAEALEFVCDAIIDSNGIAAFDMEHASSYVIIVSPTSMAGAAVNGDTLTGDSGSHAMRWIVIALTVCVVAAGAGCGIFFYRRKLQEEEYEEPEEEYDESGEEEYEEPEEEYDETEDEEEYDETEEEYDEIGDEDEEYDETGNEEEYDESVEEEYEESEEEASGETEKEMRGKSVEDAYGHSAEDDWIEDEDWQEPETPEETSDDRFADDHAEDDWIDDDEWDIGNDWIDDEEWARRKEA